MDRIVRSVAGRLALKQSNPVSVRATPGGVAHNVAVALAARGCPVTLVGVLGKDADAERIRSSLRTRGIDPAAMICDERESTGSYTAVLDDSGELVIGLADMAVHRTCRDERILARTAKYRSAAAMVLDSNLSTATIGALCEQMRDRATFAVAASAKKVLRLKPHLPRLDGLFVDRDEAATLSGQPCRSETEARAAAACLVAAGATRVFVTIGGAGAIAADGNGAIHRPAASRAARDVTGAGDAFAADAIERLLSTGSLESALNEGLRAAAEVLVKEGAAAPTR